MRDHFVSLVNRTLDAVDPDPARMVDAMRRLVDEVRAGHKPLDSGGLATLLATPEQREVIDEIAGMMSLLEGHGDVTMDRAGEGLVPSAERFGRVLRQRRESARGAVKLVQKLVGLEAKLSQYAQGEEFIERVELAGGPELLANAWRGPEFLPTVDEIREPPTWIDRVRPLADSVAS
jgi:putative hydrolase